MTTLPSTSPMPSSESAGEGLLIGQTHRWCWHLLWRTSPLGLIVLILSITVAGAARGVEVWAVQLILDRLVTGANVLPALLLLGGSLLLVHLIQSAQSLLRSRLDHLVGVRVKEELLRKVGGLPLEAHELPGFHDALSRAQGAAPLFTTAIGHMTQSLQQAITFVAYMVYVATVHWSLPAIFLVATMPAILQRLRSGIDYTELLSEQTEGHRRLGYLSGLLMGRAANHELWLFNLRPLLVERWSRLFADLRLRRLDRIRRHQATFFLFNFGAIAATLLGFILVARSALAGVVSLGALVAAMEVLYRSGSQSQQFTMAVGKLDRAMRQLEHLRSFLHRDWASALAQEPPTRRLTLREPIREICFEQVSFTYPGASAPSLHRVTCRLRVGERIALVGANGAGKSTLANLLLGLYQPTAGRILINGIDARQFEPGSVRAQCSAIFQDFERLELSVAENLFLPEGALPAQGLLEQSGLQRLLPKLQQGMETPLGRLWGGRELSGGEWQTVAMARALARSSSVLVLDEPTAALDPKAEVDLYRRVLGSRPESLVLMISHRLGACRLADRVLVLDQGRLLEEGCHDTLMGHQGLYQEMYATQAAWYQ